MTRSLTCGMLAIVLASAGTMAQVQTTRLTGDRVVYEPVKSVEIGEHVRIEKFELPSGMVDLELDRVEILTSDAQVVVGSHLGMSELARPEVIVLSGIVAGDQDSMAYLAISPYGTNGFVNHQGELISISTGAFAQGKNLEEALKAAKMDELLDPTKAPMSACGYEQGDARLEPSGPVVEGVPSRGRGSTTCRIAGIAVETDYEFTNDLFGGDVDASAAYLVSLVGAISEIYQRDVDVRLAIPYLRVWADDSDPYTPPIDPLDQVRSVWSSSMGHIDRTLVHFFTSRTDPSYGGVAYVGALCNDEYGYGVSAHLRGSFPYPLVDHNHGNWDVIVASHELGHNFGTSHTHNYNPVIDGCGNGDCTDAFGGTIMSYCHGCAGGLSNMVLQFHPRVQDTIVAYMDNNACNLMSDGVSAVDDSVVTLEEIAIDIDVFANDEAQSCESFVLESFDSVTISGGAVSLLSGQGPGGRDMFRYTPTPNYDGPDSFEYTIAGAMGNQSATVNIDVRAYRDADNRFEPRPGLMARYYQLSNPTQLPNFDELEPISSEVIDLVEFDLSEGEFMGSGLFDNVGVVLEGYVWALSDGLHTFSTSSDDGSRLLIGDEVVVNNDGLHPTQRRAGSIALRAGWHKIRIESFEAGGGASLFASVAGPGISDSNLGGVMISHETSSQCSAADLNGDGVLNFFDVSVFLYAFGARQPIADFTGDGKFNFYDIGLFRSTFLGGCP